MSPVRVFVAALVGAILMYFWTFVAHMFLPLGEAGLREMPNEAPVTEAMKANLGNVKGLFVFPGTGLGENATHAERQQAMGGVDQRMRTGPSGLLMYHPTRVFNFGQTLMIEFATEFAEALLAVFLLAQTQINRPISRIGFVAVAGVLAAITTNIPYWNWWGFPKRYTAAYMLVQFVGFVLVGVGAALVLKKREA